MCCDGGWCLPSTQLFMTLSSPAPSRAMHVYAHKRLGRRATQKNLPRYQRRCRHHQCCSRCPRSLLRIVPQPFRGQCTSPRRCRDRWHHTVCTYSRRKIHTVRRLCTPSRPACICSSCRPQDRLWQYQSLSTLEHRPLCARATQACVCEACVRRWADLDVL